MDEAKAAAYYDELKSKGAGAKQFKHGLGFGGGQPAAAAPPAATPPKATVPPAAAPPPSGPPQPQQHPQQHAQQQPPPGYWPPPYHPAGPRPPVPHPGFPHPFNPYAPMPYGPPPGSSLAHAAYPPPHMRPPPGAYPAPYPGPPQQQQAPGHGAMQPQQQQSSTGGPPRGPAPPPGARPAAAGVPPPGAPPGAAAAAAGFGAVPPGGPPGHYGMRPPPPGVPLYPGMPHPYMGMPPGGPYPPRPLAHAPAPAAAAVAAAGPPRPPATAANSAGVRPANTALAKPATAASDHSDDDAPPQPTQEELERELEAEAAAIEAAAARAEAEAAKRAADEAEAARQRARAWTAHKSADGQVYYHNTLTGESSWEKPAGFTGDDSGVEDTPVPVAQASVAGTEWYEVKCADGRRYYFNHHTQETAWSMPPEVAAVKKKQAEEAMAAAEKARQQAAEQRARAQQQLQQAGPGQGPGGLVPPGAPGFNGAAGPGFWGNADAFRRMHMQRMMDARAQQQGGAAGLSKEARVQKFKQLLLEGGVNAFSFYAKVKGKLEKDERWKLLPNDGERRAVFDEFCKNVAEEQKALAAAAEKQAVEGFKSLLGEALQLERQLYVALLADSISRQEEGETDTGSKGGVAKLLAQGAPGGAAVPSPEEVPEDALELSLENLGKYWSNDERWEAAKPEQRASLFNARFGAAAAAAAERKRQRRKQLEADYRVLLQQLGVHADSSWSREVRGTVQALVEKYEQQQQEAGKQPGTKESNGDTAGAADGADTDELEAAAEKAGALAAAALDESDRESLFRVYVAELMKARERQQSTARQEQQRAAAAEARLAEQMAESDMRQRRAARADAIAAYNTLLSEVVREAGADFAAWMPKLKKDPLKRASNALLSDEDLERLFSDHLAGISKAAVATLVQALEQHLIPLLPPPLQAAANTSGNSSSSSDPAVAAAAEAWRRSSSARQLPEVFRRFEAVDNLVTSAADERWMRQPDDLKMSAWRNWVDEVVWNRPPVSSTIVGSSRRNDSSAAAANDRSAMPPPPPGHPSGHNDSRYSERTAGHRDSRGRSERERESYGSSRDRDREDYGSSRDRDGGSGYRGGSSRDRDRDREKDRDRGDHGRSSRGGSRYEEDERDRKRRRS